MRILRLLLVGAILVFVGAPPCQAQAMPGGPSMVFRGHDLQLIWFIWNPVTPADVAVYSSDPQFFSSVFCDGQPWPEPTEDWLLGDYTSVIVAQMKINQRGEAPKFHPRLSTDCVPNLLE